MMPNRSDSSWSFQAARLALALVCGAGVGSPRLSAQSPSAGPERDCFEQLANDTSAEIVCRYRTRLRDDERADLRKLTREALQDARCIVDIRIERQKIELALSGIDHVLEAPPQPVTCEISTKDNSFPIAGTFAPRVVFKAGTATDGSPGLANVTGVNGYLAWPVVQYVNRSPRIRDGMLGAINDYLARRRGVR